MNAVWVRLRVDARRRWRAWLGVALLVGLFGGIVTTTAAGARRTDTAYSRFVVANHGAEYMIDDFIPNPEAAVVDPKAIAALRSIAEADLFRVYGPAANVGYDLVASPDGRAFGTGLNRLKVLQGRLPDPRRADEAVADFTLPGARVGQRVSIPLISSTAGDTRTPDFSAGPVLSTFTVVGIVSAPSQFPPFATNQYFTGPSYYLTPAFYRAHETSVAALEFTLARLRPGAAGAAQRQVEALGHGRPVAVQQLGDQARDVNRSTHLVAVALWLLAGLLMVVAVLIVGQLLARQIALDAADYPVLRSLGMTRWQLAGLAIVRCTAIGAIGAALAVGVAIALSPLTPIGLARTAEPAPGLAFDALVLITAVAGTTAIAAMLALWPAWRAARAASPALRTGDGDGLGRRSVAADASARAGLPATLTAGVRMALERGRGPTSVPVHTTIGGAIVGLGALVASLTFGASLSHLLGSPPLYGVTWDTEILNNDGPGAVPAAEPVVRADPDVASAAFIRTGVDFRLGGRVLSGFAFAPVKGTFAASMLTGRAPAAPDEVALGARTAAQLDARAGTTLLGNAENDREGAPQVPVRVVGTVVLPPGDPSSHLGDGVMVTRQALVRLSGGHARSPYVIAVAFRPGVDTAKAVARLDRRLSAVDRNFFTQSPATPADLVNFGRIQDLPLILGSVLAVMALLTLAHLLTTSIRRRRRDLAILKMLGFARGDVGRTVAWQATTLAVAALVVAVPLGVAAGRTAWRLFAEQLGVIPDVSTPVVLLTLVVPATILLANLISIGPATAAMRIHPASVLREE